MHIQGVTDNDTPRQGRRPSSPITRNGPINTVRGPRAVLVFLACEPVARRLIGREAHVPRVRDALDQTGQKLLGRCFRPTALADCFPDPINTISRLSAI